ncbi:MAG: nucleoside hydrolase [Pseudomonadota bacterium]
MSWGRRRKVVIDTDPGIDDAIALLWACGSPLLDIRAVTTVGGNVGLGTVTTNALNLLHTAGHKAPVYAGARRPLKRQPVAEARIHGSNGLGGIELPQANTSMWSQPAVAALADLLKKAPEGALDLLLLGPMTNLAKLLQEAPEAAKRLGRVIAMGGAVDAPGNTRVSTDGAKAEFNIAHDPEAAAEVFQAVTSQDLDLTLIPLDCTRQFRATRDWAASLTGPRGEIAGALIGAYFEATAGAESRPLHDPCVPLLAAMPEIFELETRALAVDLEAQPGVLVPGVHKISVAIEVDAEAARRFLAEGLA